jgi:peptidoglycan hydrolase-like protein with peptidoglycan-binding domain
VVHVAQPPVSFTGSSNKDHTFVDGLDSDSDSELSELSDDSLSDDSLESDDDDEESLDFQAMSLAEQAEHECFGEEYTGPVLSEEDASRMLVVMAHASTCPCHHKLTRHRDVCKSAKFMMLHVRDCPGTTASFDVCPFPWCRKVKQLLYHLVSCETPESCRICSPSHLSESLKNLSGLNKFRAKKHRQRMMAALKARNSTAKPKGAPAQDVAPVAQRAGPRKVSEVAKSVKAKAIPIIPAAAVGVTTTAKQNTREQAMPVAKPKTTTTKSPPVHPVPMAAKSDLAPCLTTTMPIPAINEDSRRINEDSNNNSAKQLVAPPAPLAQMVPDSKLAMAFSTSIRPHTSVFDGSDDLSPAQDLTPVDSLVLVATATAVALPQRQLVAADIVSTTNPGTAGNAVTVVTDKGATISGAVVAPAEAASGRTAVPPMEYVPDDKESVQVTSHVSPNVTNSVATPATEYPATTSDSEVAKLHVPLSSSEKDDRMESSQPIDDREMSRMKTEAQNANVQMEINEKEDEVSISNAMASRPSSGALKIAC